MTQKFEVLVSLLLSTIYESPEKQVPSGYLYAGLLPYASLDEYESVVGTLVKCGLMNRDSFHLLSLTDRGVPVARALSEALSKNKGANL